jgi:hypothetical protein
MKKTRLERVFYNKYLKNKVVCFEMEYEKNQQNNFEQFYDKNVK